MSQCFLLLLLLPFSFALARLASGNRREEEEGETLERERELVFWRGKSGHVGLWWEMERKGEEREEEREVGVQGYACRVA